MIYLGLVREKNGDVRKGQRPELISIRGLDLLLLSVHEDRALSLFIAKPLCLEQDMAHSGPSINTC